MKPTLHAKILGGLGFLVALLLLVTFAAYRSTGHLADAASQSQRSQEILTRLESLLSTITDAETGQRGYSITGDESFLEPYRQATQNVDAEFAALRHLVTDPARQQRITALAPLVSRRLALIDEAVSLRRDEGFPAAQRLIASRRGKALHDEIRQAIAGLIQGENELLRERDERTRASKGTSQAIIVASGLGVLVLAMVMLVIINRGFAANARARKSLAAANAWHQAILDSANQSIIATDAHGIVQTFNRAAERMLGYDAAEVVGRLAPPLHDTGEVRRRAAQLSQELGRSIAPGTEVFAAKPRLGTAEEREWTYIRKNGSRFPVLLSVNAMRDAGGQITGFMGIGTDLSERQRTSQALAAASAWRQTMLDSADVSIIATDTQGIIQTFNRAAERMLGYDAAEMVGKTTPAVIHDAEEVGRRAVELGNELGRAIAPGFEVFVAKARLGEPDEHEWTYIRKDGSRFPVRLSVTAMLDSEGQLAGFMGIASDLSEHRREEERFRRVVEAAPNGFVMIDPAGRITLANAQLERLFGYTPDELLGLPIDALVPERYRAAHPGYRTGFFAAPRARAMGASRDLFGLHKDGAEIPIEIGLSPIDSSEGQFVLASIIDISERKQAEQALRDLNRELRLAMEQAQAADRIKSAFLATMSHELRTPLNSIIGFTGIVLQGLAGPLNAEQAKQLTMVRNSARHLLALINDVLDISKIEAGELRISRHPFELAASIAKVVGLVTPLAEQKGLALKVEIAPGLGLAVNDERRFEQILLNLLGNAIKFTERGTVALSAELLADCKPASAGAGPAIRLQVSDTGMGIKSDDLATLFQPFRQIDSGLARNHEGTGLGLAICRRLADIMGGEIVAASTWGEGSSFSFTLPLQGQPT